MAEADGVGGADVEDGGEQGAGLRDVGDVSGVGECGAEAGVEFRAGHDEAEAVGADDADVAVLCGLRDALFQRGALFADFFEAGRDDDDGGDAQVGALFDQVGHEARRDGDDDQVGQRIDLGQIGVGGVTEDFVGLGIDRVDGAGEPGVGQVFDQFVADLAGGLAGSDDCDGSRRKEGLHLHRREPYSWFKA